MRSGEGDGSDELRHLDARLARALATGDESELTVLGYGEVSCALALGPAHVAKPLPPFPNPSAVDRYVAVFHAYLDGLRRRGIEPVASRLEVLERDGCPVVWCIQERLPSDALLPVLLRHDAPDEARDRFVRLRDRVIAAAGPRFGVDAQASNWADVDGRLRYLDVTTPLVRDGHGRETLDTGLFLAALPAPLRPLVRRFALRTIVDKYYAPRGALLDLLGNLHKERLGHLVEPFLAVANERLDPPITSEEVRRYYRADAAVWEALLRVRRLDRAWRRRVRGRPYPFLLPGPIER
ncbi:MAG: DUF6206 family protein [Myxococcota bacterium]